MKQIASIALRIRRDFIGLETVIEKHLKLTEYDCYQTVTEYIHEKCFDLQVCFY